MLEDFLNALQNFRRNKTRTFLSLLGVIIGVASVIVITSMGKSSTKQVEATFGTSGLDVVSVSAGYMRRNRDAVTLVFDENFREGLFENVKDIKKIWYKNSMSATLTYEGTSATNNCTAVETGYLEMYQMQLESGTFFNITDNEEGLQKIILGHDLAESLFSSTDVVGKTITVVADKVSFGFQVIGVLKEQTSGMESGTAFIPRGFYAKKIKPSPAADTVLVQAVTQEKSTELVTTIQEYCRSLTGTDSVRVNSMQTMLEQMSSITNTMSVLLAAVAAISLLVGGIGIMNIMIVTVTERRQEIGIRKALGASPRDIKQQFLIESASITVIGGLIGVILGVLLSFAVEFVQSTSYCINTTACVVSFAFSVVVGIVFGLSPAIRAARLDPVDALSA